MHGCTVQEQDCVKDCVDTPCNVHTIQTSSGSTITYRTGRDMIFAVEGLSRYCFLSANTHVHAQLYREDHVPIWGVPKLSSGSNNSVVHFHSPNLGMSSGIFLRDCVDSEVCCVFGWQMHWLCIEWVCEMQHV